MSGTIQFNGVISGLNTSAIIQAELQVYQQPINQLQAQGGTLTSQQTALNQLSTDANNLYSAIQALGLQSNVDAKTATTNTPSGSPAIISATAGSAASNGSYQVTVKQLATATRVTSSSPDGGTTAAAIGNAVNQTVPLSSAGFGTPITTGTFTINGKQITIDANTVLNDPTNPDSIVSMINNAGAGVTASIVNDAYGRPNEIQLTSAPGQSIQLGNSTDTSNFLSAVGLTGAAIVGNTATTVTGSPVAAGALSASITVDGTTVAINQTNSSNTGAQNAVYIVQQLNAAGLDVTAAATGTNSDQIQLTQNTLGSQQTISVSVAGTNASSVGLTNGIYQNGTDKVVTPAPLGEIDPTQSLSTQNFATPLAPVSGGGTIEINGTQINWSSSDSLNDVITRINSSGAGVTAAYDSLTDRVSLSNSQTGGGAISLQDVSGNLLQSLHLTTSTGASVPQQLGQNATVNISGVNNGQDISSSSNTLNNVIPGVDLNLLQQSSTPVTLTIGQDTTTTVNAVQNFVSAVNTFFGDINTDTATSSNPSQQGVLTADPSIQGIESTLESLITSPVVGGTPGYNTLSSIGITLGSSGSSNSTTNTLQLNTSTLTTALQNNPNAVSALFAGLSGTLGAVTQTSGSGNFITGATGLPTEPHTNGNWVVTVDSSGNATAQFNGSDGSVEYNNTATLTANGSNSSLIPGVTLTTGSTVQAGTFKVPVTWTQVGAATSLGDYLQSITDPTTGLFASRTQEISSEQQDITNQVSDLQNEMNIRQQGLEKEYATLETTLAQLQMQSSQLSAEIGAMGSSGSSSTSSSGTSFGTSSSGTSGTSSTSTTGG